MSVRNAAQVEPLKDWCLIPAFVAATTSESAAAAAAPDVGGHSRRGGTLPGAAVARRHGGRLLADERHVVPQYVCLYVTLEPLKDWCLIPAFVVATTSESAAAAVEHYLVPPSLADMVVDYSRTSIMSAALRHCFGCVGVPELSLAAPPPLDGGTSRKAQ